MAFVEVVEISAEGIAGVKCGYKEGDKANEEDAEEREDFDSDEDERQLL